MSHDSRALTIATIHLLMLADGRDIRVREHSFDISSINLDDQIAHANKVESERA